MHSSPETVEGKERRGSERHPGSSSASRQSDLLELCFPRSAPASDELRRLAYANSICLLFVILAIVGIKTPVFVLGPTKVVEETIPVVFDPPPPAAQPPVAESQYDPDLVDPSYEPIQEMPQVVPVLVADSAQVNFAIPVEGPVVLTPSKFAAPPPRVLPPPSAPVNPGPPRAVEFQRTGIPDGGIYPEPDYPRTALQRRMEGRVMLYVVVDQSGTPSSVEVRDSSGWSLLDNHALNFVKRRWHWPAGKERHYLVPFRFQITKN